MRNRLVGLFVAVVALGAGLVVTCSSREEERSTAGFGIPAPAGDRYSLAADLELPSVPANRGWYGVWLMLLGPGSTSADFVQAGLMRAAPNPASGYRGHGLAPFVAFRRHGEALTYREMPALPARSGAVHRFEIVRDGDVLRLRMDGRRLDEESAQAVLTKGASSDFQLSSELFRYGDQASGIISHVRVCTRTCVAPRRVGRNEYHEDRGTCMYADGDRFVATGVFRRGTRATFLDAPPAFASACPAV